MRASFVVAVILALGLIFTVDLPSTKTRVAASAKATEPASPARSIGSRIAMSSIATYPDRGQLLATDHQRRVIRSGASTWYPVQVSEEHALRAIVDGGMTIPAPNGESIRLRYERHYEHPDGNWTWIGRGDGSLAGTETILTFGEKAVFGTIHEANADLRLITEAGSTWLVETDYSRADHNRLAANNDDFLIPVGLPNRKAASAPESMHAGGAVAEGIVSAPADEVTLPTTVDVAMGFTAGFATRLGGASQARTRLHFLVDVTNQAYRASGINAQIRLVRALQVDYADATNNRDTLYDLSSVDCTTQANGTRYLSDRRVDCTPVTQSTGLQPLIAAREAYGADLVVLVRKFEAPEQASCGSAWMLGGGQNAIEVNSAAFGMSVISDSSGEMFPDEGSTCPEVMLAHELGHNMGQQHDVVTAQGTDDSDNNGDLLDPEEFGRHAYSFGFSTDGTGSDIATIMSNRRLSQTRYRVFSNPLISSCGGAPCGTAEQSDNARSMTQTMPIVAAFRQEIVTTPHLFKDINGDGRADIFWKNQTLQQADWWVMNGASWAYAGSKSVASQYRVAGRGDFDGDGRSDVLWEDGAMIWLWRSEPVGGFSIHFVANHPANGWTIAGVDDLNGDGRADIFWSNRTLQQADWWLMNGAAAAYAGSKSVSTQYRVAGLGDFDGDGRSDVLWEDGATIWIWRSESAGGFSVHFVANHPANGWAIAGVDDLNGDNRADLFWSNRTLQQADWWFMNGSVPSYAGSKSVPTQYWVSGLGDFDGDGRSDVLWEDGSTIWIWRSQPGGFSVNFVANHPGNGWMIAP